MTEQERAGKIRALIEERRGYEARGEQSRVDLVDKSLRDLGAEGTPPAKRAATRVIEPEATRVVETEATEVVEAEESRASSEGDK